MAGIYLHIPFCKTRCTYCDFFSSTNRNGKGEYIEALCTELHTRNDYLKGQPVETVYFGGGTPSQLEAKDFDRLFDTLYACRYLSVPADCEVTLEANPDDISREYLRSIRHLPFNRISLGIQSFDDRELQRLNRRHNAQSAVRAVGLCKEAGFTNISIDLMYGLPGQTPDAWRKNVRQAIEQQVQHISAYHLTYEEGTGLHKQMTQGRIRPVDEESSVEMFEALIDRLAEAGFEQYEISNFARPGYRSRHNSAYWSGAHYLGIGAAAHSYNGTSRQWNAKAAGADYLNHPPEREIINEKTANNDFIITRLRTTAGLNTGEIRDLFGAEEKDSCLKKAAKYLNAGTLELTGNRLRLTRKGLFLSDGIMSELMK
ncbi:MAG: radical SAM family heme chaperone HemW [Dysgonamonadaceae bacterium]|jgi:oxygen-independent coproporphyrinogen-3 oxidase|nr:radical SAM family heme chaperone HemW [Dysgonamonadaceae bacterium]